MNNIEQQKAIDAFLQENNIAYGVRYVGETVRDNGRLSGRIGSGN